MSTTEQAVKSVHVVSVGGTLYISIKKILPEVKEGDIFEVESKKVRTGVYRLTLTDVKA